MSDAQDPVGAYLDELDSHLAGMAPDERAAILDDIRSHFAEALASGESAADTLARLAPPRDLARAYSVDAAIRSGPDPEGRSPSGLPKLLAAVALASAPALVLIILLGGLGLLLLVAGVIATGGALLQMAGAPVDLTAWEFPAAPLALLAGLAMTGGGLLALFGLRQYLNFAARLILKALPAPDRGQGR